MAIKNAKVLTAKGNKNIAIHAEITAQDFVLLTLTLPQAAALAKGLAAAVRHAQMPPSTALKTPETPKQNPVQVLVKKDVPKQKPSAAKKPLSRKGGGTVH